MIIITIYYYCCDFIAVIFIIFHQVGVEKSPTTVPLASTKPISLHSGGGAEVQEQERIRRSVMREIPRRERERERASERARETHRTQQPPPQDHPHTTATRPTQSTPPRIKTQIGNRGATVMMIQRHLCIAQDDRH
jgi:hypothetical protein